MRSLKSLLLPFLLCLFSPTLLSAQALILPKAISFTGAPAYSQAELLAFTGLKPGATSTAAAIQAAAQRLNDTGLFTDIQFESNAHGLVFALKPMPNMLPARFTNFVWWSAEELNAALKSHVPLYTGSLPQSGNMQEAVSGALKAMLAEKGITATIVAQPSEQPGAPASSIAFAIESPKVRAHTLTFASASPEMQAKLDKVVKDAVSEPYDQYVTNGAIASQISNIYHNDGYLDVAVRDISRSAPQITPTAINIDLTATIHEGEPYRISQLTWSGSDILTKADFDKQVKLHPEDIASETALKRTLQILARAYYAKGYQDARIQAPATKDAATHHVAYTINVIPGEQYRIHSITALGLTDQQRKDFNSAWKMNPGDVYDVTYLESFLLKNTAIQSLRGLSAQYKAISDPNTHLVDLTVTFVKGGTLVNAN